MDALGNPTSLYITPGQAHDLDGAEVLVPALKASVLIADKSFDADARMREPLQRAGKTAVIPPRDYRRMSIEYDAQLYKERHLIENFFCKLKQFRAIATRYDKTARNFLAAIYLVASFILLN